MNPFYIDADNDVIIENLRNRRTGEYLNGATLTFSLFRTISEDAAMTAGSAVLTSDSADFTDDDVGKQVVIRRAGAHNKDLRTTIVSRTSGTQVVLSTAASKTVTDAVLRMSLPSAANVSMDYVSGSNGKYQGTLDEGVALNDGDEYFLGVTVDAGSDRKDFRWLRVPAKFREDE